MLFTLCQSFLEHVDDAHLHVLFIQNRTKTKMLREVSLILERFGYLKDALIGFTDKIGYLKDASRARFH